MAQNLVFISGASSGIGLALAQTVPFEDARIVDISRRGAAGFEHLKADLADPASWREVAACFDREVVGYRGARAIFVHNAGTLEPMGFAGEVDLDGYARSVLLGSAATQVLGAAFLAAASRTEAACTLLMISSGAAHAVYPGWSAYGAGKAAMDQWVRTVGAEQSAREGGCRVLSVAPGIVETAMQAQIRETPAEAFPEVAKFVELHEQGVLREPRVVAVELWGLVEGDLQSGAVVDLREAASG